MNVIEHAVPTTELLERWRDGDVTARNELIAAIHPWLTRRIETLVPSSDGRAAEALDLAQTSIVEFLEYGPKFVPATIAQFHALLERIARNSIVDERRRLALRAQGRHLESLVGSEHGLSGFSPAHRSASSPSWKAGRAEERGWIRLALHFLDADDRYLLVAADVDELPWATIAAALGLESPDAARVRCARLRPRVARILIQLRGRRLPGDP